MEETKTTYYDNGNKKSVMTYVNDELNGLATTWFINGNKCSEGNYVNGKKDGIHNEYYKNENKKSKRMYTNGITNNLIEYYDNGCKLCEIICVNGCEKYIKYCRKGNVQYERIHANHDLDDDSNDEYIGYHPNGNKNYERTLNKYIEYYYNGNKKCVRIYDDDIEKRTEKCWLIDGTEIACNKN